MSSPTVATTLAAAIAELRAAGVPTPEVDARLLMGHVLGIAPSALPLHRDRRLEPAAERALDALLVARAAREPLQHLLGTVEFHGRSFRVAPGVLIPRFETESVVERALAMVGAGLDLRVADIGTGSGVIGLTLAAEKPAIVIVCTDRSPVALALARANARDLAVTDRVMFVVADLTDALAPASLDLLVANPPYVPTGTIATLAPEVRDHDPHLALDGGPDGLDAIRALLGAAPRVLRPGGGLVIEIGDDQGRAARDLAAASGLVAIDVHPDLAGRDRVLVARRSI